MNSAPRPQPPAPRSQRELDFRGAEADAASSFRYRMTRLRERLRGIDAAAAGVSPRRWEHIRELLMAIYSYMLAGRQPELGDLVRTSGLSRDQLYRAREGAMLLGLVATVRRYQGTRRQADGLSIVEARVAALERAGPADCDQLRPSATNCDQVRPSANSSPKNTNPRAPAGAAKELPINLSSSSETRGARREERGEAAEEEEAGDFGERWRRAVPTANRLLKVLAPGGLATLAAERREWITKVALLAERFGAAWIEPAFEQLRYSQPRNPQALLAAILDDECQRRGTRLNRELARVQLTPPSTRHPQP